ncbi:MAG: AMP-binding protein [Acidimicrobiia bacterium]|nr:AMP-binding protein [Acidimicrobiia bacterium]
MSATTWLSDEQHTVVQLLDRRLEADPDGPYLDVTGTSFTAAEVADRAWRLAGGLRELGLEPGERVASLLENSPEAMLFWWAAVTGGHIAVPINTAYKGEYLRHQLIDSGARVLVVQADLLDRAAPVVAEIDELAHVVVVGDDPEERRASVASTFTGGATSSTATPVVPTSRSVRRTSGPSSTPAGRRVLPRGAC